MAILDAVAVVPLFVMLLDILWCKYVLLDRERHGVCIALADACKPATSSEIQDNLKTPLEALDDWSFLALGVLCVTASALVIAGSSLAFGTTDLLDDSIANSGRSTTTGVRILCASTVGYIVLALGLVYCASRTGPENVHKTVGSVSLYVTLVTGAPFLAVRLVWAVGSAFSAQQQKAVFSPFRDTDASTYVHVGTVVVMEFLCSVVFMFHSWLEVFRE